MVLRCSGIYALLLPNLNYGYEVVCPVLSLELNSPFCYLILLFVWLQRKRLLIREIVDHATFRVKGANSAWLDKLGLFPSLALCNKANFGYLQFPKYSVLYKCEYAKKSSDRPPFLNVNHFWLQYFLIF